ncbi:MAG: Ubiquitin-protein ligase [Labilithrix sp.]|nr:Ubiquitin-protein ligase [Labilithrix sp.]
MTPAAIVLLTLAAEAAPEGPPPAPPPEAPASPELLVPIVHSLALMTGMRVAESVLYPDPFSRTQYFGAHYAEAFTKPPIFDSRRPAFRWDGDPWPINVVGHGLFGSELYLRSRLCGLRWYGALAFAAAGSTLWEYAFEGNGVRPSAQDLIYTPLMGLALGEARHAVWLAAGGLASSGWRTAARVAVDPFGEIERALGSGC